jgi:hypothetical protein
MYRSTGFGSAMLDAEVQDGGIRAVLSNKSTVTLKPGRARTRSRGLRPMAHAR